MVRLHLPASAMLLAIAFGGCASEGGPATSSGGPLRITDQLEYTPTLPDGVFQAPPLRPDEIPCIDVDGDGFGRGCAFGGDCDDFDPSRAESCGAPVLAAAIPYGPDLRAPPPVDLAADLRCEDGTLRDCYGDPVAGPTPLDATCTHGLRLCAGSRWGACRIDSTFTIPAAVIRDAVVSGPTMCSLCDPTCFTSTTFPTTPDLTPMDSMGVLYSPVAGGITLPVSSGGSTTLTDMDGDGVPDIADCAPTDPTRNCITELGGFYHALPMGTSAPPDSLIIMTMVRTADVYFLMDTTGSMGGAISNLKSSLTTTIIPSIATSIPDAWFGVGHHDDLPCDAFGTAGLSTSPLHHDWAFEHMLDVTSSAAATQTSVNRLGLGDGYDLPESQIPALWAVASRGALFGSNPARTTCPAGTTGYPCFRRGTIPIVILFTDAEYHNGPMPPPAVGIYAPYPPSLGLPTYATTIAALNAIGAKVIVVYNGTMTTSTVNVACANSGTCGSYSICSGTHLDGYTQARALATATGAIDSSGAPLVYTIPTNGTGLTTAVTTAIANLANYSRMNITLRPNDNPATPAVNETGFVASWTAISTPTAVSRCVAIHSNWFEQCLPGTAVSFNVTISNTIVAATAVPQVFTFTIDELGDGTYLLGTTPVTVVVPPMAPTYPASGTYWRDFDSTVRCSGTEVPRWGTLTWTATYPAGTQITWQLQTAPTAADLPTAPIVSFVSPATASPINVGDKLFLGGQSPTMPFLRVTTVLQSSADRLRAPVLSGFDLTYACIPGM